MSSRRDYSSQRQTLTIIVFVRLSEKRLRVRLSIPGRPRVRAGQTREIAILVASRETNYNLEWNGHEAIGLEAGLDARSSDVVRYERPLAGLHEKDATVIRFGRQLSHDRKVDSATFAKAVELWGKRGTMDMVAVMSTQAVNGYFCHRRR
jgi:hypothetical protein